MLISGYQGIGKSTLTKKFPTKYVDFESSNYNKTDKDWFKKYIDDATKLQETYEIVFVSSHAVVRQYLREQKINYKVILPHAKLYKDWCDKLLERSIVSGDIKDTRAFGNCYKEFYNSYTEILINDNKNVVVLESMDYDLDEIIKNLN